MDKKGHASIEDLSSGPVQSQSDLSVVEGTRNKYRFETVKQDKDLRLRNGTYYVHLGGQSYVSLKTKSLHEARDRKLYVKKKAFAGERFEPTTLATEIALLLERSKALKSHNTYVRWEIVCRLYLGPYCKLYGIRPEDWNNSQWEHYVSAVRQHRPGIRFANHRKVWSKLSHQMFDRGHIRKIPKLSNPDPKRTVFKRFTAKEIQKILEKAGDDLKLQIILATHSPRLREILHLRIDQVDLKHRCLELDDNKTKGRKKYVPLSLEAVEILTRRLSRLNGSRFVFPSPKNPHRPINDNKTAWRSALIAAKIIKDRWADPHMVRFHDLRSFAITRMLNEHGDVYQVAKIAGNSPDVIKAHYDRLDKNDLARFAPKCRLLPAKKIKSDRRQNVDKRKAAHAKSTR